jgi:hypothetical protein
LRVNTGLSTPHVFPVRVLYFVSRPTKAGGPVFNAQRRIAQPQSLGWRRDNYLSNRMAGIALIGADGCACAAYVMRAHAAKLHQGWRRNATTTSSPAASDGEAQNAAHASISLRRLSSTSLRAYAASILSPLA